MNAPKSERRSLKALAASAGCAALLMLGASGNASAVNIWVGTLPVDGSSISFDETLAGTGDLDFFAFTLAADVSPAILGSFLNIQTKPTPPSNTTTDTEIGLYDSGGNLVASDDDGNDNNPPAGIFFSLLSFGDDPFPSDVGSGFHGDSLAAGDYTLVVGGFNTLFTQQIGGVVGGGAQGPYTLQFTHSSTAVPEPAGLSLLGLGLLAGVGAAVRKRRG